jgi:hypothetical protein
MNLHDEPRLQALLQTYFQSFNTLDEASHLALFDAKVDFFGSLIGVYSSGKATPTGVLRGARNILKWKSLEPVKVFGKWPEAAALVSITIGDEDHATTTEGIWHFVFNDDDHIAKLSILWDTKSLLL